MLTANAKDVEQRVKEGFIALLMQGPQADEAIKIGRARGRTIECADLLTPAVVGSLLLAILSTIADYVWFLNIPQHQVRRRDSRRDALRRARRYLGWRKGSSGAARSAAC
jgi:hypothetical protein